MYTIRIIKDRNIVYSFIFFSVCLIAVVLNFFSLPYYGLIYNSINVKTIHPIQSKENNFKLVRYLLKYIKIGFTLSISCKSTSHNLQKFSDTFFSIFDRNTYYEWENRSMIVIHCTVLSIMFTRTKLFRQY